MLAQSSISPAFGTILGSALGAAQFAISESGVPKGSNCSYLAPWTTDLGAWLVGAFLIYRGFQNKDGWLALAGSTIASIHVAQFASHKTTLRFGDVAPMSVSGFD